MKKCKECGAIQSNGRVCRDCGARLGKPMSPAEEAEANKALGQKISDLVERSDDFYVPIYDKIMGILCIVGIIVAIVLFGLAAKEMSLIDGQIPDNVHILIEISSSSAAEEYSTLLSRMDALGNAIKFSLISIVILACTCLVLLAPKFMWSLGTLKYRLFYEWDTPPSYVVLTFWKIGTYILFIIGIIVIVCGYWIYF